jgi:hypothetical protein
MVLVKQEEGFVLIRTIHQGGDERGLLINRYLFYPEM